MSEVKHISVLLEESIEGLNIKSRDVVVDGTFGGGGHSQKILEKYGNDIKLICVDLDEKAKIRFDQKFLNTKNVHFVHSNFKDADYILNEVREKSVDKVLLDLGTSTFQLLDDSRGFSFNSDTPLKMTFSEVGSHTGFNAYDIVNEWEEESIADIIYAYGEENKARQIAKAIVKSREEKPINTSKDLSIIIENIFPKNNFFTKKRKIHPATKTFQALRIAVNDELRVVEEALDNWWKKLNVGGRISVITFHSLEDRVVKKWSRNGEKGKRVITKKPIVPDEQSLKENPRARSAKLRIIEKENE